MSVKYIFLILTVICATKAISNSSRVLRQAQNIGCILPEHPLQGFWTVYKSTSQFSPGMLAPLGSVLQVSCENTYKLDGDAAIVCINGEWTTRIGQCLKTCPSMYSSSVMNVTCIYNGRETKNCTDAVDGTVAHFKCAPFYEDAGLERHPAHVCFNGKWSYSEPECVPICGQKSTKKEPTLIVNGTDAPKGEYPWQVALYNATDRVLLCGGSLLNQRVILTAAHCISNEKGKLFPKETYMVAVGKYYREFDDRRDTNAQFSEIYEMFKPREYRGVLQNYLGDIAIIVTKKTFILSTRVQPVCVDWDSKYENAILDPTRLTKGFVTGWGFTLEYKNPSEVLKQLEVPLISYEDCVEQLLKNEEDYERYMTDDKVCAGYLNAGTSVCRGDSGGGLVFKFEKRYYIKAVVSLSPQAPTEEGGCDSQQYTLFTRVSRYVNEFILTKETQYKPKLFGNNDCEDNNCNVVTKHPVVPSTTPQPIIPNGNCLLLEHPTFGRWSIYNGGEFTPGMSVVSGTILKVQCFQGYQLEGKELILCVNGTWSSSIAQCAVSCPSLISTSTVTIICTFKNEELNNCNNPPHGTVAKYTCAPFYEVLELVKNPGRVCINGTWDSKMPECIPVCGKKLISPQLLIINGRPTQKGDYPWHVAIYRGSNRTFVCSGTLINQRLVLTAAHCLSDWKNELRPKEDFLIAVGKLHRKYEDARDRDYAQFSLVEDIAVPLEFRGSLGNLFGDIAVLVAKGTFTLTQNVIPACMDWASKYNNSEKEITGYVSGWGFTRPDSDLADELKELKVPIVKQQQCFQNLNEDFRLYLTSDKFCAGYLNNGSSVCKGDAGGGLVVKNDGRYYVSGILSSGPASTAGRRGCDNQQYALYTDVTKYNNFILQKDAQYKQRENEVCADDDGSNNCKKSATPPKSTSLLTKCILPPHPKFGSWNLYANTSSQFFPGMEVDSGQILQISCRSSYALDGPSVILCEKDKWSSEIGNCLRTCPPRYNTTTTKVTCFYKGQETENCNMAVHNTRARFTCAPFHEDPQLAKQPIQVCLDGSWDHSVPKCQPICGLKSVAVQTLIINGGIVKKGSYPWHVAIYHGRSKKLICSGSLISHRLILTSAQCVTNNRGEKRSISDYTVAAGKYYRNYTQETKNVQFQQLSDIVVLEAFKGPDQLYIADIAILVTQKPFELSTEVQPVCMDWSSKFETKISNPSRNLTGYVTGWGYTTETSTPSDELRDLKVPIVGNSECRNALPSDFTKYLTFDKFCGGYFNKNTGICKGDSGGGLVVNFEGRYYLAGIVSLAPLSLTNPAACNSQNYGLYTKISPYINDIFRKDLEYQDNS